MVVSLHASSDRNNGQEEKAWTRIGRLFELVQRSLEGAREKGLFVSGSKAVLTKRIQEADNVAEEAARDDNNDNAGYDVDA